MGNVNFYEQAEFVADPETNPDLCHFTHDSKLFEEMHRRQRRN